MRLTEWEEQRLLLFSAAELARRHRDRGLLLNAPEAVAIICDEMLEAARAGASYEEVEAASGDHRSRRTIEVTNTSARVVRVSSHYPFHRVNARLVFDRAAAAGHRLDLDAGSSERWAPGESKVVALVAFDGTGPRGDVDGGDPA